MSPSEQSRTSSVPVFVGSGVVTPSTSMMRGRSSGQAVNYAEDETEVEGKDEEAFTPGRGGSLGKGRGRGRGEGEGEGEGALEVEVEVEERERAEGKGEEMKVGVIRYWI
ncbi:hypothetical protein SAICODRAFT_10596 [Saitoella complicata NRRL Y-17804]|uniref:uncharacterized protein n=1 Tax=Saitoella complicata (strain BCRC 22490 / CBS 7301 / JCM 7358 / NBRC 10748 / NRRL Y-17804) TaxID=698492 RepID=UPI000867A1D2|nr:uncharacterized protein SAICODRAFT_10596 [Saitoella complicata NRRL Y-17804]ODQ49713.1 hypothetical protein SAICODRAFT_10596 [Saitoella complicata NRRL Y-17804]